MSNSDRFRTWIGALLWPLFLAIGSIVMWTVVGRSGDPSRAFIPAVGLTAALVVLERIIPLRKTWEALTDPQLVNDAAHSVLQNELGVRLGEVALALLVMQTNAGGDASGGPLWPDTWPFAAQLALALLLADGLEYWRHRLLHRVPWLWRVHALHHSAERMHVLKGGRLHALDLLLRYLTVFLPLLALGVPRALVLWYAIALLVIGPISHANLALRFPVWVHRILVTPSEHRLHHARELALAMSNFAPIFPLWDMLFGTFRHPDAHTLGEVGIEDDPVPRGFLRQCVTPFSWSRVRPRDVAGEVA
jgi:sterol desaturase/sphingolipid hydroxylase (fatty acid hydroxylase superfamily)